MKLFLLSAIFMNVFVIPWGLGDATSLLGGLLGILASHLQSRGRNRR